MEYPAFCHCQAYLWILKDFVHVLTIFDQFYGSFLHSEKI